MHICVAAVAGAVCARVLVEVPAVINAVKPVVKHLQQGVQQMHMKALSLLGLPNTKLATILSRNPPRKRGGNSTGSKGVAGKPLGIKKTPSAKLAPGSASSRRKKAEKKVEELEGDGEEDTAQSGKKILRKQLSLFMYMVPKPGEGDKNPVTGPAKVMIVMEKKGRVLSPLHINDWSVKSSVWAEHKTNDMQAWVHFLQVPPADNVRSDQANQELFHICVFDLHTVAENKGSNGLAVPKDMVEIIKKCANEIIARTSDLNTVMAAGGPRLP